jgi:hypothetical protein
MTYGTGAAAFEEALHHPCRTRDPAAADLFFVPAFSSNVNTNYVRSWCAEQSSSRAERVRHRASCDAKAIWARLAEQARTTAGKPYFEIHRGLDHIMLTPKSGIRGYDTPISRELDLRDHRLANWAKLAVEASPNHKLWAGSLPWASSVHVPRDAPWTLAPWRKPHEPRARLVALVIGNRTVARPGFQNVRAALVQSCSAHSEACERLQIPMLHGRPVRDATIATAALYARPTFCLQPGGDSPSRKGVLDAVTLGCIPVFFQEAAASLWPWHWAAWRTRASVVVPSNIWTEDAVAALQRINSSTVAVMRRTLAEHAHCLHYAAPARAGANITTEMIGSAPDAFEIVLAGSWRRSKRGGQEVQAIEELQAPLCRAVPLRDEIHVQ